MDNLIHKFYSNGKEEEQKYTQFGALSNSLLKNTNKNFLKPNISLINPAIHNIEKTSTTTQNPKTPNKTVLSNNNNININENYLYPKKLIFNSSSDLFPKKNFAFGKNDIKDSDIGKEEIPSLKNINQRINTENKKNITKMQMMEEKMKNLELKSQRLEVINDFFFDMFENNLVKEELKKNKDDTKDKNEVDNYNEVNEYNENNEGNDYKDKKNKKKRHKKRKKDIIINTKDGINNEDAIKNEFIKQTDKFSRKYLNTVKTDLGLLLVEEQLKKNENLNNITEEILDLKGDLMNQLERIQMKQASEMKKIAYCLQNSGDEKVENLANRLFGEDILKPEDDELNFNSKKNSILYSMSGTKLGFSGTIFNNPNLLKTNNVQKKSSIDGVGRKSIGESRRKSIGESRRKSIDSNYKENNTSKIKFKDDDNYMKTKISTLLKKDTDTIIEENNDENYAD